jgi:hypothetical protein
VARLDCVTAADGDARSSCRCVTIEWPRSLAQFGYFKSKARFGSARKWACWDFGSKAKGFVLLELEVGGVVI